MQSTMCQPHDEQAVLNYLDWQKLYRTEKPFQLFSVVGGGHLPDQRTTNLVFKEGGVETIHDVRGTESQYSLNKQGFTFRTYPTRVHNFGVRDEVENVYLLEMEELLRREVEGIDQVYFFDWRIRKNVELTGKTAIDANDKMQYLLPAKHVHIDQTPSAVLGRMRLHLPQQADFLLQGRVRVINIWRPIIDVVEDQPLTFCDARTVEPSDLVEADHVRKHYNGSNFYAKPSHRYRWHYLNRQRKDEVTLLKMFDSDPEVEAKYCLHTSFTHHVIPEDSKPRESIEVRALVFTYDENDES
ncbi:hypothetical protein ABVK25_001372 [Lepraria finkii]|uniref:Methyltransferase n=1 Tax=Lepraria finkii TaxID=1340010 RepID=A0ABR4BLH6_9LECA